MNTKERVVARIAAMAAVCALCAVLLSGCATAITEVTDADGATLKQKVVAIGGSTMREAVPSYSASVDAQGAWKVESKTKTEGVTTPNTIQDVTGLVSAIAAMPQLQAEPEPEATAPEVPAVVVETSAK